jgi:hypothetical protein
MMPLCLGYLLFGELYLDLDLLHTSVCNYIQFLVSSQLEFYDLQVNLSQGILLLESLPCDSIELVNQANQDNLCVSCVCEFALRFVCRVHHVLHVHHLSLHKSRESVKIGPHPWGQPLQVGIHLCLFTTNHGRHRKGHC